MVGGREDRGGFTGGQIRTSHHEFMSTNSFCESHNQIPVSQKALRELKALQVNPCLSRF